ncbi:galactosyltransferase-related protein [Neomicrococcus aestuarii]|uniref:galactosyltransferase-related protein n=1 Tax=Neomicrococcus aestuarii TaxID=556325 RepID=UPI0039088C54
MHGYSAQPSVAEYTQVIRETNTAKIPVPNCNCAFIREAFLYIGGFDESFAKYGREDSELSIRARLAGLRIIFYPPMQVKFSPTEKTLVLSRKLLQSG